MDVLGIDIGGSGIKGAPVSIETGEMTAERHRIVTPHPATPDAVVDTVAQIARHFKWKDSIGVGFPAAIKHGVVSTASNIDETWIGKNAEVMLERATGCRSRVINDADAAGMAEMHFGAGRNRKGVVLMITLGTGIGTAIFVDGKLVPNTELGHIEIDGKDAETRAADSAREREEMSWAKYAKRLNKYLSKMEALFWPDLIIIGGGVSKQHAKYLPLLTLRTEVLPAQLRNEAGIIGAAVSAIRKHT